MDTCPFCQAILAADFQGEKCPRCGKALSARPMGALPSGRAGGVPEAEDASRATADERGTAGPPETPGDTAGPEEILKTLQAAGPASPSVGRDRGTNDERRLAQTVRLSDLPPPPKERERGTADEHRIAQTLQLGAEALSPAEIERKTAEEGAVDGVTDQRATAKEGASKGTADGERIAATLESGSYGSTGEQADDSHRYALTMDSKDSGELIQKVSLVWSGKFGVEATPRTSLKADALSVDEEASLVIQSRVLTQGGAGGGEAGAGVRVRADYELLGQLGEGGMGVVLAARQASINRTVALKKIKPAEAKNPDSRRKFLSEAIVTGDLEHPNIVPIYDLGKDGEGVLFYAMKHVKGTPWDKVIAEKSFEENLEIWMKVADAVAFAHSRCVVHRDLKPENVMLGGYGEVLLMDWGLALAIGTPSAKSAGMAGTPAYMAPEMAVGPVERIGLASDIYLLGAILFEIITGTTPHTGTTVTACLLAAARNEIQATDKTGELLEISRRAMATNSDDRYGSVSALQDAVRAYRSHSESISLSVRAEEDLREAATRKDYEAYARALFGFQEAYELWEGNTRAKEGVLDAALAYARRALANGDYDLAASLVHDENAEQIALLAEVRRAHREREARQQRLKTARQIGLALVASLLVVITVAFFWISGARATALAEADKARTAEGIAKEEAEKALAAGKVAEEQKVVAEKQKEAAVAAGEAEKKQKDAAEAATKVAEEQRKAAVAAGEAEKKQKEAATAATQVAKDAEEKEKYAAYIARIGLAAAKIEENAFDRADALLNECPAELRNWEWGRLKYMCDQGGLRFDAKQPVDAIAFTPDGKQFASGGWGGTIAIWDLGSSKSLREIATGGSHVFALAFSPDGKYLAAGTNDRPGYVKIYDTKTWTPRPLLGHRDAVVALAYSQDGKLLATGSYDMTVRLWDPAAGTSGVVGRHQDWVWSVAFSKDARKLVTACQDGSVSVWSLTGDRSVAADPRAAKTSPGLSNAAGSVGRAEFFGHSGPVYAAIFAPGNEDNVVSAGYDKRILVWRPGDMKEFDWNGLQKGKKPAKPPYQAFEGHTSGVHALEFSLDGRLLVSGGHDNTVRVWDFDSGKLRPRKTLRGHSSRVRSVALGPTSPTGDHVILSGGYDRQVKLWTVEGYAETRVCALRGHRDWILGASLSPDGKHVLSASRDRTARLWDAGSGRLVHEFSEGHEYLPTMAVFLPDGKQILTAGLDNTTRLWDMTTGTELRRFNGTGTSGALALAHNGQWILTGGDDKPVTADSGGTFQAALTAPGGKRQYPARLWNLQTGRLIAELKGHPAEVIAAAFAPHDRLAFTGDAKGFCRLWQLGADGSATMQWQSHGHGSNVTAVAFLPDGKAMLSASTDNTVAQWRIDAAKPLEIRFPHKDAVKSLSIHRDGRIAITACDEVGPLPEKQTIGVVKAWDLIDGRCVQEIRTPLESINSAQFSPDGRWAVVSNPGRVRLYDVQDWKNPRPIETPQQSGPFLDSQKGGAMTWYSIIAPNGASLLTVGGNDARLWSIATGQEMAALSPQGAVAAARFSPDGKRIVTGGWDHIARIWDVAKRTAIQKLQGDEQQRHKGFINDTVFTPDGGRVVTAGEDRLAKLWEASSGRFLGDFAGHSGRVRSVCVFQSDAGLRLLTASDDKTVILWDLETRKLLKRLTGHTQAVLSAAASQDGKKLLTGGDDGLAILWNAETLQLDQRLEGHTAAVTSLAFSPDGRRAITGSRDNTAKLWELQGGKELLTLKGHTQDVTSVAFSSAAGSRGVVTGSMDGTVVLWPAVEWKAALGEEKTVSVPPASVQAATIP